MQGEDLTVSVLPFRNLLAAAYAWLTRTECVGEWQAGPQGLSLIHISEPTRH